MVRPTTCRVGVFNELLLSCVFFVLFLPCCSVIKQVPCSDSNPEIVLGHVKCPAMLRHKALFCVLVALVSMYAQYKVTGVTGFRFAEKKESQRGTEMKKRKGENAEQLKGHGAEHWVHSVSDNVSQWLKPSKCQQPAHFTVMILIRQKRRGRPASTSQSLKLK